MTLPGRKVPDVLKVGIAFALLGALYTLARG
jgi:hypothetical protein